MKLRYFKTQTDLRKWFEKKDATKSSTAAYEQPEVKFPAEYEKKFKANKKAWSYFQKRNNTYKKTATWWVIKAKREETRENRLKMLIEDSENSIYIKPL